MAADTETSNQSTDQLPVVSSYNDDKGYELSGKIMLGAIVLLVVVLVFMAGTHIYFKWYLHRLRRTQAERLRRRRGVRRSHINFYTASSGDFPSAAADRGLEPSVLNSLPVFLHSAGDKDDPPSSSPAECAVCLSEFEEREIIRLLPKCGHAFHIECIDMWFKSHSTCPLCRAGVEPVVVNRTIGPAEWCGPGSSSGVDGGKVVEMMTMMSVQVPDNNSRWGDENSGNLNSPMMRKMLSLRRILSMGRRPSPGRGGGGGMMTAVAETSSGGGGHGGDEDLESGIIARESSQNRVDRSFLS